MWYENVVTALIQGHRACLTPHSGFTLRKHLRCGLCMRQTMFTHTEPHLMAACDFCADECILLSAAPPPSSWWEVFFPRSNPHGLIVLIPPSLLVRINSLLTTRCSTTPPMHPSPSTSTCSAACSWLIPYTRCHLMDIFLMIYNADKPDR